MDNKYASYLSLSRKGFIDYLKMTIALADLTLGNVGKQGITAEIASLARQCREDASIKLLELESMTDKEESPQ
jgi:hypothetical protein